MAGARLLVVVGWRSTNEDDDATTSASVAMIFALAASGASRFPYRYVDPSRVARSASQVTRSESTWRIFIQSSTVD